MYAKRKLSGFKCHQCKRLGGGAGGALREVNGQQVVYPTAVLTTRASCHSGSALAAVAGATGRCATSKLEQHPTGRGVATTIGFFICP